MRIHGVGRSYSYLAILSRPIDPQALIDADEKVARMFEAIQILPEQLSRGRNATDSGERRLIAAILEATVSDLQKFRDVDHPVARRYYAEALDYITSGDMTWPYSFGRVCQALNLDADWLRAGLLARFGRRDG